MGETLASANGPVKTAEALAGKVVAIYFSAHWCPPCRGFTPKFADIYNKIKAEGKNFEVVFASSDRDDASFKEYFAEMPWLALPFDDRKTKEKLSKMFKVSGIPTLVIMDADGKVITKDGRSAVMQPEKFPWVPPTLAEVMGTTFVDKQGAEVSLDSITSAGKNIGLYFSAHWCGPCRAFTPELTKLYNKLTAEGKPFEVIFVSSDRDQAGFDEYYGEMPWLALPFADRARKDELSQFFKVQGIPTFVMIGPDLKVINASARGAVMGDKEGANFPWAPKPVTDVDEDCEGINDTPTVLVLMEEAGDKWDELGAALETVAKEEIAAAKARDEESCGMLFMTVTETGGGIGAQIRKLAGLGRAGAKPQLCIVDCPESGAVMPPGGAEVNEASIRTLVQDFRAGKLLHKPFSN